MPAYLIAEHIVTDPAKFQEYLTKAGPMMAKHGARYLTKGSTHKLPEGGHWKPAFSSSQTWISSTPGTTHLIISRSSPFVSRAQAIKTCCSCLRAHSFKLAEPPVMDSIGLIVAAICRTEMDRRHHHRFGAAMDLSESEARRVAPPSPRYFSRHSTRSVRGGFSRCPR
jgi:hypothetical protein